ncbi:hypothetical protein [Pseudomonas grimontii]|uniref:hypothetical protein n=1 Tax=Pseudomonas grimontii TaxID=129847 RepID=UPI0028EB4D26|nr:hypothetical protein [Pseudomonas grimontii]
MSSSNSDSLEQPGTPDPGFGINGNTTLSSILNDIPGLTVRFRLKGLATDNDGKLLFSASLFKKDHYVYGLGRLNLNGSLDTTFTQNALVTGDFVPSLPAGGSGLTLQADGKILMAGWTSRSSYDNWADLVVARFDSKGSPDTNFAEQGWCILQTRPDEGLTEDSVKVHVQQDGCILVSANYSKRNNPALTVGVLFRLLPNGALDTGLNGNGKLDFKLLDPAAATAINACISQGSDYKIVIAGHAQFTPGLQTAFFARLNPDGTTDTGFGSPQTPGFHRIDSIADHTTLYDLVERADKSLIGAGQVGLNDNRTTKGLIQGITPNGAAHQLFNKGKPMVSQFDDNRDIGWQRIMNTHSGNLTTASEGAWIYIAQFKADGSLNIDFNNKGYIDLDAPVMSTPLVLTERGDQRVIVGANVVGTDPAGGIGALFSFFG